MSISLTEPLDQARLWTHKLLFIDGDPGRWFALGFCAFLYEIGNGGGGGGNFLTNFPPGGGGTGGGAGVENLSLVVGIAVAVMIVIVGITTLVLWLGSRGTFVFLDGIVCNRARIGGAWSEFAPQAQSLFYFRLLFTLGAIALFAGPAFAAYLFMGDAIEQLFEGPFLVIILLGAVVVGFAFALVQFIVNDFVVPLMYLNRSRFAPAWREATALISRHLGSFLLYLIFRVVLAFAAMVLTFLIVLLTCCIAAIPYIGTVIRLPILVFMKSYNLYFLSQFGGELERFARLGEEGALDLAEVFE